MLPSKQELSNLVGNLYDATVDQTLWAPFLRQLALYTQADGAGLFMHSGGKHSTAHSWEIDPEMVRMHRDYYGAVDVWWVRGASLPGGSVRTSQSICPILELRRTEAYNDCLVRFDIEHGLFAVVENGRDRTGSVSLFRKATRREFQSDGVELFDFIVPHLQRAYRLSRRFDNLKSLSQSAESALQMLSSGVILLETSGKIVFSNHIASGILLERNGLLATRDGLSASTPAEAEHLARTIRNMASQRNGHGRSSGATVLISRRNKLALQLLIGSVSNLALRGFENPSLVVFINDPSNQGRPKESFLREAYELTGAECRVALLLGDGHAPKEIANKIGVTENTVRSQIKSIFSKTGVKRQAELVRLLLYSIGARH